MKTPKRPVTILSLALVVAGGAAAAGHATTSSDAASAEATAGAHAAATTTGVAEARRAVTTAGRAVGGGRPYDIERDHHRGAAVWEVKVAAGTARPHEILVSSDGRTVVARSRDHRSADALRVRRAKVSLHRAIGLAARHGRGAFSDAEIDRHRGRLSWEATFKSGRVETEVVIDADTGRVLDVNRDTDD